MGKRDTQDKVDLVKEFVKVFDGLTPTEIGNVQGIKFDQDKPDWDLLPYAEVESVVRVLTSGAKKYAPDNWKRVPEARSRYFAAAMRHLAAWREGEANDAETGESHLAHATCCLLFLAWVERAERK